LISGFVLDMSMEHYETSKGKYEYCYCIDKKGFSMKQKEQRHD
jgi:hypothetical protein